VTCATAAVGGAAARFDARCPADSLRTGGWRLLAGGELSPDRGDVLIELGSRCGAAVRDAVEGRLTDMASQAKSSSGQHHGWFCHITKIPDNA
jgi:hypothetical protein